MTIMSKKQKYKHKEYSRPFAVFDKDKPKSKTQIYLEKEFELQEKRTKELLKEKMFKED